MKATGESGCLMPAFIADCHLGKLAKYLRLMGFDTLYFPRIDDNDLIDVAKKEGRIILTRDKALSEHKDAPVLFLEPQEIKAQLQYLVSYYNLRNHPAPFSRCIVCNTPLKAIGKEKVLDRVPEKIGRRFNHFEHCSTCDRIYWHGDHYHRMQRFLESLFHEHPTASDEKKTAL